MLGVGADLWEVRTSARPTGAHFSAGVGVFLEELGLVLVR